MWIAGNPGTRIFTRPAEGSDWQSVDTPIRAPISRIHFVDESHGWAISQCGDVIHSEDSGQSWSIQRRGTRGVALLQIGRTSDKFVPELFSKYSGDDGYICAALKLDSDPQSKNRAAPRVNYHEAEEPSLDMLRQAMSRVGGSFVDNRIFQAQASSLWPPPYLAVDEYLVRQIRILRPRVIAIPSGRLANDGFSIRSFVLDAVNKAADTQQHPFHMTELGLDPWQVGKVVVTDRGEVASLKVTPGYYMMSIGALVHDHAAASRALLNQHPIEPRSVSLTTIFTSPFAAGTGTTLFGSIESTDAEIPVRKGRERTAGNMAEMRQLASKQKTLAKLLENSRNMSLGIWNTSLSELSMQLGDAAAGVWLYELAGTCDSRGETELAIQTHLYLTNQYRKHPLAVASLQWLFDHYSSAEQAWISIQQAQVNRASLTETTSTDDAYRTRPVQHSIGGMNVISWEIEDPRLTEKNSIALVTWTSTERDDLRRRRYQQARAIAQSLALVDSTAMDTGRYQMARIGLTRKIDPLISVDEQLKRIASGSDASLADTALLELGLNNRTSEGKLAGEIVCAAAATRPWLDGSLSDDLWKVAIENKSFIPLNAFSNRPCDDRMLIAADDEFLYLAIRCRQQADATYDAGSQPRSRDSRLQSSDRVEIAIDIDRDYGTSFLFCVDSSGRVADSFGNNLAWNPSWYVASRIVDGYWVAEVAIPLDEISRQGDTWSVAVHRYIRNQLVSCAQRPSKKDGQTEPHSLESRHIAAMEGQSGLQAIPMQAFRHVKMPWSSGSNAAMVDLPLER